MNKCTRTEYFVVYNLYGKMVTLGKEFDTPIYHLPSLPSVAVKVPNVLNCMPMV